MTKYNKIDNWTITKIIEVEYYILTFGFSITRTKCNYKIIMTDEQNPNNTQVFSTLEIIMT